MAIATATAVLGAVPAPAEAADYAPRSVIVGYDGPASERSAARAQVDAVKTETLPPAGHGIDRNEVITLPPGAEVSAAVRELDGQPGVAYAEPDYAVRAASIPTDPGFNQLWGLENYGQTVLGQSGTPGRSIRTLESWELTTGSANAPVAVIDTGIDFSHSDLSTQIATNPGESGGGKESNGVDDDGNGKVDDWHGWDFVANGNNPSDLHGHGTHVAGTIAAKADNAGIVGIAPDARILPLRVLNASGAGYMSDLGLAFDYAAQSGVRIANASLGSTSNSQYLSDTISGRPGTLLVTSAGNDGADVEAKPTYPCANKSANIVCVAATDNRDQLASFSNFGTTSVDLAAPGVAILSDRNGGGTVYLQGTSMAAPHVAGAAALAVALDPSATTAQVKSALVERGQLVPGPAGATVSGRRLDARATLGGFSQIPFADGAAPASVSGAAVDGQTLTAVTGSWSDPSSAYSYRWMRCAGETLSSCVDVVGASGAGSTYQVGGGDVGLRMRVRVSAQNPSGVGSSTSVATVPIVGPEPASQMPPTISAPVSPKQGDLLSGANGIWSGANPIAYAWQWQRCAPGCTAIAGATGSTYTLTASDVGARISFQITATNSTGFATASSAQTALVQGLTASTPLTSPPEPTFQPPTPTPPISPVPPPALPPKNPDSALATLGLVKIGAKGATARITCRYDCTLAGQTVLRIGGETVKTQLASLKIQSSVQGDLRMKLVGKGRSALAKALRRGRSAQATITVKVSAEGQSQTLTKSLPVRA